MPGSIIFSNPIPTLLELERLFHMIAVWMLREVQQSVDAGLSAPSSNSCRVPSVGRLTICRYVEILKQWMPYYDVANLVTVTKTKCRVVMSAQML